MTDNRPFEGTLLWKRTLAAQYQGDPHEKARLRLRAAYEGMRRNAATITAQIQKDFPFLTLHDINHLDALWTLADLIAGDDYQLTPTEAFVFGAGILLHDAGITISAFPGGLPELKDTPEWADAAAVAVDKMGTYWHGDPSVIDFPAALFQQIVFSVLRSIHGRVAETLCGLELENPNTGARMRLLEDDQLRLNYGSLIGQIASSHNWPIEDIPSKLQKRVGAIGGLPAEWSIDPVKVAGLLRCADAAQIDQRRAPDFLYALLNLSGLSEIHWRAQSKLAQPVRDPDDQRALLFSSTGPYLETDADAWWVAWDLITVANNELQATASLMRDTNRPLFQINRVRDADSPSRLANHVTTFGWMPVRADLKVSNPEHVAKILGGRELYGNAPAVPLRELLQNASDAIRARRYFDPHNREYAGTVNVRRDGRVSEM